MNRCFPPNSKGGRPKRGWSHISNKNSVNGKRPWQWIDISLPTAKEEGQSEDEVTYQTRTQWTQSNPSQIKMSKLWLRLKERGWSHISNKNSVKEEGRSEDEVTYQTKTQWTAKDLGNEKMFPSPKQRRKAEARMKLHIKQKLSERRKT